MGARELFLINLRIAHLSYQSALYLCGDIPADPRRLPEFCVSLPVSNRAILDSLFTVLFVLRDRRLTESSFLLWRSLSEN
jgi:hypothetical protein